MAPSYSMGSRLKTKDSGVWQRGPGSYEVGELKRGPAYSLGVRDSIKTNNQFSIPGPGAYNTNKSSFTKSSAPSYSMGGRSTINNSTFHNPGPGAYNIGGNSKTKLGPNLIMNSRASDVAASSGSSFGGSTMKSTPSFSFGARSYSHVEHTPGPGAYNVGAHTFNGGPAYSIASRENRFNGQKGSSPGPGAYNISSIGGHSAPSYSIAQKH